MGLRIATNVASISAQRQLARSERRTTHAMQALASGSRIVQAGDDAAGFAISEVLRGQSSSLRQAKNNAENAKGLIQVAEGGLNEQNNIVIRLRELAVQSASDTVSEDERGYLNEEFKQLLSEMNRIAKTTTYGNKTLLAGSNEKFEFQLGVHNREEDIIRYTLDTNTTTGALGLDSMSIQDRDEARDNLTVLDDATGKLAKARAGFGAIQSRLEVASNNLDLQNENITAARSRISDADVAFESAELVQGQVAQDFGISVLSQANQSSQRALKLLS